MHATWTWKPQIESTDFPASGDATISFAPVVANSSRGEVDSSDGSANLPLKNDGAFKVLAQSPVIALGLLCWRWITSRVKNTTSIGAHPAMRTISHLALGGRKTITLVEVEGQRYLVGGGADSVTSIVAIHTKSHAHMEGM